MWTKMVDVCDICINTDRCTESRKDTFQPNKQVPTTPNSQKKNTAK